MSSPSAGDLAACLSYYETTLARERYREPGRLVRHGAKVYSQNDEDGILQEIFRRIGHGGKRFIEFGVQDGVECNTLLLLCTGWRGTWLEADAGRVAGIERNFEPMIGTGMLTCKCATVTTANVDDLLRPDDGGEIDLLSIDVDFHDYWVWKALSSVRPRVVTIEYNATLAPPLSVAVPYKPEMSWDGSNYFGASLVALEKLGREKGYSLVGCCFSGVNAFFVRDDLVGEHFCAPFTAENHFEPARYFMRYPAGHPPSPGIYVDV